jgi:predicted nucleic acid-binding protein
MFLVDTNVWLERLLDQERSEEVGQFLDSISSAELFMSDFTLHSIGLVLTRLNQKDAFLRFLRDAFIDGAITLLSPQPEAMSALPDVMDKFGLDFDDAYQYMIASRHAL